MPAPTTEASPAPDPWAEAEKQWPYIKSIPHIYSQVPGRTNLEAWPPTESGTPAYPRPKSLPEGQFGIEIFDRNIRPLDVLGDVVSHGTRFSDPKVRDYYQQFERSITPQQEARLRENYAWEREHYGERRPYATWRSISGLPSFFRGYAFRQTGDYTGSWEQFQQAYTPGQRALLDQMMQYIGTLK
jgi:hypothetical protein